MVPAWTEVRRRYERSLTLGDVGELRSGGPGHREPSTLQDRCLFIWQLRVCDGHRQSCGLCVHLTNKTTTSYHCRKHQCAIVLLSFKKVRLLTVVAKQDSSSSLSLSVSALGSSPSSPSFFTSVKKHTHTHTFKIHVNRCTPSNIVYIPYQKEKPVRYSSSYTSSLLG